MKDYVRAARDAERRKAWDEATYFATMAIRHPEAVDTNDPEFEWAIPEISSSDVPPAVLGIPKGAFEAAVDGASALDHFAQTPEGMNLIAHAVHRMFRQGWVRSEAVR